MNVRCRKWVYRDVALMVLNTIFASLVGDNYEYFTKCTILIPYSCILKYMKTKEEVVEE